MKDYETLEATMSDLSTNKLQPRQRWPVPTPFQLHLSHIAGKGQDSERESVNVLCAILRLSS